MGAQSHIPTYKPWINLLDFFFLLSMNNGRGRGRGNQSKDWTGSLDISGIATLMKIDTVFIWETPSPNVHGYECVAGKNSKTSL